MQIKKKKSKTLRVRDLIYFGKSQKDTLIFKVTSNLFKDLDTS